MAKNGEDETCRKSVRALLLNLMPARWMGRSLRNAARGRRKSAWLEDDEDDDLAFRPGGWVRAIDDDGRP